MINKKKHFFTAIFMFFCLFAPISYAQYVSPHYDSGHDVTPDNITGDTVDDGLVDNAIIDWKADIITSATDITLDEDDNLGDLIFMTAAGEVGFPDCDSALVGWWVSIFVRDSSEQVELVMSGDTTNDLFRLKDGTDLDANDEADCPTNGNEQVTVMCLEANKWYIISQDGDVTDGGVAD